MDIKIATVIDANNPVQGDLYLENGTVRLTTGGLKEEVGQRIYTSLRLFLGEWFLDPSQGIPYFQTILGRKVPVSIIAQIFRSAIVQQPGVQSLDSLSVTMLQGRQARIDFACTLDDGATLSSSDFGAFVVGA